MSGPGPLAGYLVVDFTQILAGPFCTQMLADAGATVIKVEPPGGEFARRRGPLRENAHGENVSSYAAALNRGKRSVCLDLKNVEGHRLARALMDRADVVVENFRPGVLESLDLGLAALRSTRPEVITCSISLFGSVDVAGDLASRGGLASIAEAESGLSGTQRGPDGSPTSFGFPLGDTGTGLVAYGGIMTALLGRERTGAGQHVDISMVMALMSLNPVEIAREEIDAERGGEAHVSRIAGYGLFPAADGHVAIGIGTNALFRGLASAMDQEWMVTDSRYAHFVDRDQRADEVDDIIARWCAARPKREIVDVVSSFGVPCGVVASSRDILDSSDIARLGFLESIDDGVGGTIRTPASPFGYRQAGAAIPRFDEHGSEVLETYLGIGPVMYEELRLAGAFGPARDVS